MISAIVALFVVNLAAVVTDREAVKAVLGDTSVLMVNTAPELVAEALEQRARELGLPLELDERVFTQVTAELIPPEWAADQSNVAADAVYDVLETGNPAEAEVVINAQPLLERVRGEPGRRAMVIIMQSLPVCTIETLDFFSLDGDLPIPGCIPPGIEAEVVATQAHAILVQSLEFNPQLLAEAGLLRVSLIELTQLTPEQLARLQRWHRIYLLADRWAWLLWLIPLGALFVILIVVVRSWHNLGRWWGWALVITAILAFLLSAVVPALVTFWLRTTVAPPLDTGVLPFGLLLRSLIEPLMDVWLRRIYIQAGIMLIVGLALVMLGLITGAGQRRPPVRYQQY
ncbi:MAG TPA: hypothetical protein VF177_02085 [Anaerolineae bacterium]